MVTQWLIGVLADVAGWVLSHMGTITLPSFFGTGSGSIAGLFGNLVGALESMGNWIPVEAIGPCLLTIVTCVGVGFAIRVVRWVQSTFTGGGGV